MIDRSTHMPPGPTATPAGPGPRRVRDRSDHTPAIGAAPPRRWLSDDRGTSPIELAILLPVIILALFASIQVAMYFIARSAALAAAQEAVAVQRVFGAGKDTGQLAGKKLLDTGQAGDFLTGYAVSTAQCPSDGGITITVTGQAPGLIPGFPIHVTATAHGTCEVESPTPSSTVTPAPPGPPTVP